MSPRTSGTHPFDERDKSQLDVIALSEGAPTARRPVDGSLTVASVLLDLAVELSRHERETRSTFRASVTVEDLPL